MAFDFDSLVAENIRILRPYQPGKPIETLERELGITGAIKVASNENPMGPSPRAVAAAREAVAKVHLYPDGGVYQLRTALADKLGIGPDHLVAVQSYLALGRGQKPCDDVQKRGFPAARGPQHA